MPDENTSQVYHKITNRSPSIVKFCGFVDGVCADIEEFLESLDNHIRSLNAPTEADKINESKLFFDLNKGDLKNFYHSWIFKELST